MSVSVLSFLVFAASQIGTPGPANMALLATGAAHGLRAALPFVGGVVLGKQFVIWPVGFGLMGLADEAPWLFAGLKWVSAIYIVWLAWRVAHLKLSETSGRAHVPGFRAGLAVHPLNPKAWAMIVAGFTAFTDPGTPALAATGIIAACLLGLQAILHPIWAAAGEVVARTVAGTRAEPVLMVGLAAFTVLSVFYVLFAGG